MKIFTGLLVLLFLGGSSISSLAYEKRGSENDLEAPAKAFVQMLAREDFSNAVKAFGDPLKSSLPPEELRDTWKSIIAKRGAFKAILDVQTGRVEEYGGQKYDVVIVRCEFTRSVYNVRISFNRERQITSLWFVPADK